jgi:ATP-binding cassette subfamily C (CFTR/MRP) protein 1
MLIYRAVGTVASNSSSILARQPFCINEEGWGPISLTFYDFTPCFLAIPNAVIALFGIIPGGITIWWLYSKQSKQPTPKDWHYFAKLVSL